MADARTPGEEGLDLSLTWPDAELGEPRPGSGALRDTPPIGTYLDHVSELRQELQREFRRQVQQFDSLARLASARETRIRQAVDTGLDELASAAEDALEQIAGHLTDRLRLLTDHTDERRAELSLLSAAEHEQLKAAFTRGADEFELLVKQSQQHMSQVLEEHNTEMEHSLTAKAAEFKEVARQHRVELDRVAESHLDAIEHSATLTLGEVDSVVRRRAADLEQKLDMSVDRTNRELSGRLDGVAARTRSAVYIAAGAIILALVSVGAATVAVLSTR